MKFKLLDDGPGKTWASIMDTGDEAASAIAAFARDKGLKGSHFTAIGGHLPAGVVRPTLEIVITESPKNPEKKFDPASHVAPIAVNRMDPQLPPPDPDPVFPPFEPEPDDPEPNIDIPLDPDPPYQMSAGW